MTEQQTDLRERELDSWMARAYEAEGNLWKAEARIRAVREWHWGDKSRFGHYCSECGGEYPCDTIRALESDPPPSV